LIPDDPPVGASYRNGEFFGQRREATQVGYTDQANAAELEGETADEVTDHAEAIDHEVHRHCMTGIFGATETGFDKREPCLHKHDEVASHQRPHEVDAKTVLINEYGKIVGERLVRFRGLELLLRDRSAIRRHTGQVALIGSCQATWITPLATGG